MGDDNASGERTHGWVLTASAIGFAVLFVAGLTMAGGGFDTKGKTEAELQKLLNDNKTMMIIGAYALVLAGLAFMPLAWSIIRRVGAGLSALGEQLAHWTAVLFVAMVLVAGIVIGSLAAAVTFGDDVDPSADLIRFVPQIGYGVVLLAGALCASLFLAIVSRAGQTTGAVPKWFSILGYVAAVAMLGGVVFLPMAALPIWAIAAAFVVKGSPASRA